MLLKDTLTRLPSPYAQVLWLRFGQGWSQARLAERFGVSLRTIRTAVQQLSDEALCLQKAPH